MHPSRRTIVLLVLAASLAAVLTVGAGTGWAKNKPKTVHKFSTLTGTWLGQYSGGYSGTFTLRWKQTGSKLIGTITLSSPSGTYKIGGSVRAGAIKFGAVAVGATYTGTVSGTSMSGTYKAAPQGGSWSAKKKP
jgi:hypothetical protein